MRRIAPFFVLLAVVAVFAGCGSSADNKKERAQLVTRATAICDSAVHQLTSVQEPHDTNAIVANGQKTLAITQRSIDQLTKLKPADNDKDRWKSFLENLRKQQTVAKQLLDRVAAQDTAGAATLITQGQKLHDQTTKLASGLGIQTCSQAANAGS